MPNPQVLTAGGRGPVRLQSGDYFGLDGRPVEVQVDVSPRASPGFSIVGLPGKSTRESRERIRTAIRNAGFHFPGSERILVNLAPAFQEKEGAVFDLPVALGILIATGQAPLPERGEGRGAAEAGGADRRRLGGDAGEERDPLGAAPASLERFGFLGELGLEGELRSVPGALLTASALRDRGIRALVVPAANAGEVALLPGVAVFGARDLRQAILALRGGLEAHPSRPARPPSPGYSRGADFAEVRGQEGTKRALLIAAAGGHNALVCGPPGVGKTMLARRLGGILPPPSFEESVEVTRIRSAAGLCVGGELALDRPFRAPHHTISYSGLVGGGSSPRPGEVSLAHRGVLFLDELPEFPRRALEALRQPLEEGTISIARSGGSVTFPASFILVAAMNPCPCGDLGHPRRPCRCTPPQVLAYRARISGPLLDRIDLRITVGPVDSAEILRGGAGGRPGLSSAEMRARAAEARQRAARRWGGGASNGRVTLERILKEGEVAAPALRRLAGLAERNALSVRAFERVLRVARTIADLEPVDGVEERHVDEALGYRELV